MHICISVSRKNNMEMSKLELVKLYKGLENLLEIETNEETIKAINKVLDELHFKII